MLGRRNPQRSLFDAQYLPHRVNPDSFYGRMGAMQTNLYRDDDLGHMYCKENGRPSLSPSRMSGMTLLQFFTGVSDDEAVNASCMTYVGSWELPLAFAGIHLSSLRVFWKRLIENGEERYAFDRSTEAGRKAGFIPGKVTLLTDTTDVKGAGAVQDTYMLLRKGVRQLLKALDYDVPGKRRGLSQQTQELVKTYVDQDRKAEIDWSDPQARAEHLKVLVDDVEATLALAAMVFI